MTESSSSSATPAKKTSRKSKWVNVGSVGVFLFLVAVGALYYIYVTSHQAYVIDRNFRLLALHGDLITDTLNNLGEEFRSAMGTTNKSPETEDERHKGGEGIHPVAKKAREKENQDRRKVMQIVSQSPYLQNVKVPTTVAKRYTETFEFDVNPKGSRSIQLKYQPQLREFTHDDFKNAPELWRVLTKSSKSKYRWLKKVLSADRAVKFYMDELPTNPHYLSEITKNETANQLLEFGLNKLKDERGTLNSIPKFLTHKKQESSSSDSKRSQLDARTDRTTEDQGKMLHEAFPEYFNVPITLTIVGELNIRKLVNDAEMDLEHELFDDLLITSGKGEVLYQKDSSRFRLLNVNALLRSKKESSSDEETSSGEGTPSGKRKPIKFPYYGDTKVGGISYRIFAQPIELPSGVDGRESSSLIIIGMVESTRFWRESIAISTSLLVVIVFGVLVMLLSLPLLKLILMGPRDRLSFLDVWFLLVSSFLGTAVIVFVFMDWSGYDKLKEQRDNRLQSLSDRMLGNFSTEVDAILKQVGRLNTQKVLSQDRVEENVRSLNYQIGADDSQFPDVLDPANEPYPDFDMVFWTDSEGMQEAKWTIGKKGPSPLVTVAERDYFKRVKEGKLWKYRTKDHKDKSVPKGFFIEPVYSKVSGKYVVLVSASSEPENKNGCPISEPAKGKYTQLCSVVIVPKLLSFQDPIVPHNLEFAVIRNNKTEKDAAYQVLFHSDSKRNLRENFLQETREDANLRSLIFSRKKGFVNVTYWGYDHRFYVAPVTLISNGVSLPWTLVVFAKKVDLRTVNLEYLSIALFFFGVYSLIILAVFLLGLYLFRSVHGGLGKWLWPDPMKRQHYVRVRWVHATLILLSAFLLSWYLNPSSGTKQDAYMVWATLVSVTGILFTFAILKMKGSSGRGAGTNKNEVHKSPNLVSDKNADYRQQYLTMITTLLVLTVVIPAFAFSSLAYDTEVKLYNNFMQFNLFKDIVPRTDRVLKQYKDVLHQKSETEGDLDQRNKRKIYFRERLCVNQSKCAGSKGTFDFLYIKEDSPMSQTKSSNEQQSGSEDRSGTIPDFGIHSVEMKEHYGARIEEGASWSDKLYMWIREDLLFNRIAEQTAGFLRAHNPCLTIGGVSSGQDLKISSCDSIPLESSSTRLTTAFRIPDTFRAYNPSDPWNYIVIESEIFPFDWRPLWAILGIGSLICLIYLRSFSQTILKKWNSVLDFKGEKLSMTKRMLFVSGAFLFLVFVINLYSRNIVLPVFEYLLLLGGVLLFFVVLGGFPSIIARRVFLLDFEVPQREEKAHQKAQLIESLKSLDSNLIIVGPPNSGKSALIPKKTWHKIDIRQLPLEGNWFEDPSVRKALQEEKSGTEIAPSEQNLPQNVAVDHFEYLLGNAQFDEKKLVLLEELQNRKKRICVLTSVGLLDRFIPVRSRDENGQEESDSISEFDLRWARVFHGFSKEFLGNEEAPTSSPAQLKGFLDTECGLNKHLFEIGQFIAHKNPELNSDTLTKRQEFQIVHEVAALAEPLYRSIWTSCSKDEKLALFYLAKDRYLYSDNPVAHQLKKRELIVLDPSLRLMNESFRRFVLVVSDKERIEEWERTGPPSVWRMISQPLGVVFLIIIIFLVVTQEQLQKEATAMVTLVPALLPVLFRLFSAIKVEGKPG